jgi:MarR family transcriptional regulator, 2-MHQ and catechol-resistance regulon repressor
MPRPHRYSADRTERLALSTYVKLSRASETLWNRLTRPLLEQDLTSSQFGVLEALYHLGPMSQGELARRILRSSGNLTLVLGNLEKRGLVRRERQADRRFYLVHLTAEGERLIGRLFPAHAAAITHELAVLTAEEQRTLGNLCRKLGVTP